MNIQRENIVEFIFKLIILFILVQPMFDFLSFLNIRGIIPMGISTYLKPLFVFGVGLVLMLVTTKKRKIWFLYWMIFLVYTAAHCFMLLRVDVSMSNVLHELRFMVNIMYMNMFFMDLWMVYHNLEDKKVFLEKMKKALFYVVIIFSVIVIITSVLGIASRTYEYSDANKLGLKGVFDSGQILGHTLSVLYLFILNYLQEKEMKWWLKVVVLSMPTVVMWNLGTKVPYYMVIICSTVYVVMNLFLAIVNKQKVSKFIALPMGIAVIMLVTLQYSPVHYNTVLNQSVLQVGVDNYDLEKISGKDEKNTTLNHGDRNLTPAEEFQLISELSSEYINEKFLSGEIHPSNQRAKQRAYNWKKYELSGIEYKLMGIGYLSDDSSLALESDVLMTVFSFGIVGFTLMLGLVIVAAIKEGIYMLSHINRLDKLSCCCIISFFEFLCISYMAGYTYIYTNFSIYLVCILFVLKARIAEIKTNRL